MISIRYPILKDEEQKFAAIGISMAEQLQMLEPDRRKTTSTRDK